MLKANKTPQARINQFTKFQLSQQQAIKIKGGADDDIVIEDDIVD